MGHIHMEFWKLISTVGRQDSHLTQPCKAAISDEVMMALDLVLSFAEKTLHLYH